MGGGGDWNVSTKALSNQVLNVLQAWVGGGGGEV